MHLGQRVDDPLGRLRVFYVVTQVVQHVVLDIEIRLEGRGGQHLLDPVMEPVGLHELVVEIEWDREPVGHRPRSESQSPQLRDVGCLDPERGPVPEAHIAQRCDRSDREVPLRRLGLRRPRRLVVLVDLVGGGGSQVPALVGHFVADEAAEEGRNVGMLERVADVGVGDAVLHGAHVDVRQRRLAHGGDDASDSGRLVGQRLVDHNLAGVGPILEVVSPCSLSRASATDPGRPARRQAAADP